MSVYFNMIHVLLVVITSCRQSKKDVLDGIVVIKQALFTDRPFVVPLHNSPLVTRYPELKPFIIKPANPKITNAFNNIYPTGETEMQKEQIPHKIIPGKTGFDLLFKFKNAKCINRPALKAFKPTFVEGSAFNLQHLNVEHGLPSIEVLTLFNVSSGMCGLGSTAPYRICFRRLPGKINSHL